MGFLGWLKKPKLVDDEPPADQSNSVAAMLAMLTIGLTPEGQSSLKRLRESDGEEVPGARGRFGVEPTNPILANGPDGEIVYLERLRTRAGSRLFYHRVGTTECSVLPGLPVDVFEVLSADRAHHAQLYFLMYNFTRSRIAPSGYGLVGWSQMPESDRVLTKLGFFGSTSRIDPFPAALPREVGARLRAKGLPAEAVERLVKKLEGILAGE